MQNDKLESLLEKYNYDVEEFNKLTTKDKYKVLRDFVVILKVNQDCQEISYNNSLSCDKDVSKYLNALTELRNDELNAEYYSLCIKRIAKQEQREKTIQKIKKIFNI